MKLKIFFTLIFLFAASFYAGGKEITTIAYGTLSLKDDHLVGVVYVREQPVFILHQESIYEPEQIVTEIAKKINNLYSQSLSPEKIKVKVNYKEIKIEKKDEDNDNEENGKKEEKKKVAVSAEIYWGQEKLLTLSDLQARLNNSSIEGLAYVWVKNLKKALLAEAKLKVFPSELFLAPGETEIVKITGNTGGKLEWKVNSDFISVSPADMPDRFLVKAISPGDGNIEFSRETKALLSVMVRNYGGEIKDLGPITVSGSPALPEFIKDVVVNHINRSVRLKEGAKLSFDVLNITPPSLYPGKEITVSLPLKIDGGGCKPLTKNFSVKIKNEAASFKNASVLFMSNSPEKIIEKGMTFSGTIKSSPVRLLYYHLNASDRDKWLIIDLVNKQSSSAKVWMVSGFGGPNPQEAFVGHISTSRFIKNCYNSSGQFFTVPPGGTVSIYSQRMPPKQILTGLLHLQTASSLDVSVRIQNNPWEEAVQNMLPTDKDSTHCRGIYSEAEVNTAESYSVGESEKSIYIGKSPFVKDVNDGSELYGNYGIIYKGTVKLNNPGKNIKEVNFYFTSHGGIAQGTFLIDGTLVETPIVRSSERVPIATFLLKPGETRSVKFQTIPQGGSHYPVRLLIKS